MFVRSSVVFLLAFLASIGEAPAVAEVIIELSEERLVAKHVESRPVEKPQRGFFQQPAEKGGGGPVSSTFILPWIIDDTAPDANATLFAVTNESFGEDAVNVSLTFYDESFDEITGDLFTLDNNELRPFNTRLVPGLVTAPGAVNRGILEILSDGVLSADFFDVNFGENFASGDRALTLADFCPLWRVRFLRFPGPGGGTELTFILNGPHGFGDKAPPTISGEVFTEGGTFVNSFALQTDAWILQLDALDLVIGEAEFGTIVIQLDTTIMPNGVVFEKHSAFSRFSLGVLGVCKELFF